MAGEANRTRNHDEIRRWVEERGGRPATVVSTERGGEPGLLRVDFPGYSGEGTLQSISWDEFFQKFDDNNLEFLYQDRSASGEPSRFNKFVTAGSESGARSRASTTSHRGTSTRRAASTRKTTSRRTASSRKSASARKTTSRSKSGTRSQAKRTTSRKTAGSTRSTSPRKTASGRSTSRSTSRRGTTTRRATGTTRRRTREEQGTDEGDVLIGTFESEPVRTDEVIRLGDEGPVSGNAPSATETERPRNRRRRTGMESGSTTQGTP